MKARTNFIWQEILMIRAFIQKQIEFTEEFCKNYEKHEETIEVERWYQYALTSDGEIGIDEIKYIGSLSEEEFDLRTTFTHLMPAYLLASSLMSIWSIFEREMERMYNHVESNYFSGKKLTKKKENISKIKHIVNSLDELGVNKNKSKELNDALDKLDSEIRLVRNAWAHDGGVDTKGKIPKNIAGLERNYSQILVKPEYLKEVIEQLKLVSSEYNNAIYRLKIPADKLNNLDAVSGAPA